jgi:hypothetical protein
VLTPAESSRLRCALLPLTLGAQTGRIVLHGVLDPGPDWTTGMRAKPARWMLDGCHRIAPRERLLRLAARALRASNESMHTHPSGVFQKGVRPHRPCGSGRLGPSRPSKTYPDPTDSASPAPECSARLRAHARPPLPPPAPLTQPGRAS